MTGKKRLPDRALKMSAFNKTMYDQAQALGASGKDWDCRNAAIVLMGLRTQVDDPETRSRIEEELRGFLDQALRSFSNKGAYQEGLDVLAEILPKFPDDPGYAEWNRVFRRENIPGSLRVKINNAGEAVAQGKLDEAYSLYSELSASRDRLNDYYMDQITANFEAVRLELFQERFCTLLTAQRQGDLDLANQAYLEIETKKLSPKEFEWTMDGFKLFFEKQDNEPPRLVLTSPSAATLTVSEADFTICGTAEDNRYVSQVTLNGEPLESTGDPRTRHFSPYVYPAGGDESISSRREGSPLLGGRGVCDRFSEGPGRRGFHLSWR